MCLSLRAEGLVPVPSDPHSLTMAMCGEESFLFSLSLVIKRRSASHCSQGGLGETADPTASLE